MDTFKRVNIVFSCVIVSVTITFIIVAWTLPDSTETVSNTMCLNVDGTVGCQHSLSEVLNRELSLKWNTLNKELEKANPRRASVEHPPIAVYYHPSVGDISNESCLNPVTLKGWYIRGIISTGIQLHDGRALVLLGGHYFVYSFVELYEDLESKEDIIDDCDIEHSIYKFNIIEGEERRLISHIQPHQVPYYGRKFNIYSSYVRLLVELRAGDEISVKVNHPRFIQNNNFNSFGLIMI